MRLLFSDKLIHRKRVEVYIARLKIKFAKQYNIYSFILVKCAKGESNILSYKFCAIKKKLERLN